MLEAFVLLLKLIWIVRNAVVYVPGWHCAHHFVGSFFFHSSLICLTISLSLSFFLSFSLCLINIIIIFHTFSRLFTLFFFWVCSTLWWMSHVPEVVFWFWFVLFFWDLFSGSCATKTTHIHTAQVPSMNNWHFKDTRCTPKRT